MGSIICAICGHVSGKQMSNRHLRKHGLTIAEYRTRFPDARLTDFVSPRNTDGKAWNRGLDKSDVYLEPKGLI